MRVFGELWPLVFAVSFVAGVIGNLVASLLLGIPALWHLHKKLNKHLDVHHERFDRIEKALGISDDNG
jgi:hypothetical protein